MCELCSSTVMLADDLAQRGGPPGELHPLADRWLVDHGWTHRSSIWYCGSNHRAET
jgi:hypothetical protein